MATSYSRVTRITDTVGTANQCLQGNVGDQFSQRALDKNDISKRLRCTPTPYQPLPWVFVQESHSDVESCTTPALETVCICEGIASFLGDIDHVNGSKAGGQERLVSISPCGVHDKNSRVFANRLSKSFGAGLDDNISPTDFAR